MSAKMTTRIANKLHLFQKRDSKPNMRKKNASNNKLSQNNEEFSKFITGERFKVIGGSEK